MPEILLVRHGVPDCNDRTRIRGRDFGRWVRAYDAAPLDPGVPPPAGLQTTAAATGCIVTSTLRRAIESAAWIAPDRAVIRDALFNEAGIPTAIGVPIALRPLQWDVLVRVAWLLGWSGGAESAHDATWRAAGAAARLAGLAASHGSVMLVGHGMLNTLIGRVLRRGGWTGTGSPREYWGCMTMRS